jgi:hypothetical protein
LNVSSTAGCRNGMLLLMHMKFKHQGQFARHQMLSLWVVE